MSKKRGAKRLRRAYGYDVTLEPAPETDKEEFVPYPLERFLTEKALWAANYFVLWPIGLALTADVEIVDGFVVKVNGIHVREWTMPTGEKRETINQSMTENKADYEIFLAYVRERLMSMKPEERRMAMRRLANNSIASPDQILGVEP